VLLVVTYRNHEPGQGGQQPGNLWPERTHKITHDTGAEVGSSAPSISTIGA
jgi:hypothetical protein